MFLRDYSLFLSSTDSFSWKIIRSFRAFCRFTQRIDYFFLLFFRGSSLCIIIIITTTSEKILFSLEINISLTGGAV